MRSGYTWHKVCIRSVILWQRRSFGISLAPVVRYHHSTHCKSNRITLHVFHVLLLPAPIHQGLPSSGRRKTGEGALDQHREYCCISKWQAHCYFPKVCGRTVSILNRTCRFQTVPPMFRTGFRKRLPPHPSEARSLDHLPRDRVRRQDRYVYLRCYGKTTEQPFVNPECSLQSARRWHFAVQNANKSLEFTKIESRLT